MGPITSLATPQCTKCKRKFPTNTMFDIHMKRVHGETEIMRIDRITNTVKKVLYPEPVKDKSLDCTECGLIFLTKEEQEQHNKLTHSQKVENSKENSNDIAENFSCNLCDKPFTSKGPMVNHVLLVHTVRTKEIQCDFCEKLCTSKLNLCSHISSEHAEFFVKQEKGDAEESKINYKSEIDPNTEDEEGEVVEKLIQDSYYGDDGNQEPTGSTVKFIKGKKVDLMKAFNMLKNVMVQGTKHTIKDKTLTIKNQIPRVRQTAFEVELKVKDKKGQQL